jgi:putative PIN family toxin of toxin-antitoxin system
MLRRIVLDTSVVVAALRSRLGAGNAVLRLVASGRLVALATPPLFLEYEEVLLRPEQRLAHGLTPHEVEDFLAEFAALMEPVELHFRWRPQSPDSSDEMVIEAAVNGRADAVVTYNIRHFLLPCRRFGVPVLTPAELLKKVKP